VGQREEVSLAEWLDTGLGEEVSLAEWLDTVLGDVCL
jgi:hypothetical protein